MSDPFLEHRNLLLTVAYEMLGSAADAEDVVQESWLRWDGLGAHGREEVHDARAYLVRVATRQALNRLRTLARRREDYVGEWLPEPLLTSPDVAEDYELAENVSLAMLTVLETLTPTERAVFVLREVFDFSFEEIAASVDKTPAAVRQVAHRARQHVAARRPRVKVSATEHDAVITGLMAALDGGDLTALMELLAPDVVLITDGGGLKKAALRPILGAEKVMRFLAAVMQPDQTTASALWINGQRGLRFDIDGLLDTVVTVEVVDGKVARLLAVRNPEKLGRVESEFDLSR
ncbi:MAG: RNA polymerase sigma-70 factor [Marmoricola sp.]